MSFCANIHFGCTVRYREDWRTSSSKINPTVEIIETFEKEGIRMLGVRFQQDRAQFLIEAEKDVAPSFLIQRLKGRWSRFLGVHDESFPKFSRHFFVRTLGHNTREIVSNYVHSQVENSDLADPLYRERMKNLCFKNEEVVLARKTRHQGVYDLYAHVVLVTHGRYRMFSAEAKKVFGTLREGISELDVDVLDISMMPDHAHLLVQWPSAFSAEELLERIKRASGKKLGMTRFWSGGGYVGAVGPYRIESALEKNAEFGWQGSSFGQKGSAQRLKPPGGGWGGSIGRD